MYFEEREFYILDEINKKGRVSVSELSKKIGVSEVTIRKDLSVLEEKNRIKRTFGGAIKIGSHVNESSLEQKKVHNKELKQQIAEGVKHLISDGLDIFLDAGTTTYEIVDIIKDYKDITVITYDMTIGMELSNYKNIKTYILGGYIEHKTKSLVGINGYKTLENLHADICFIGTDAFDDENVYSTNEIKSLIKMRMLENSKIRVLVSDSSKYSKDGLFAFYRLKDFDYIISDTDNDKLNRLIKELEN